jgi:hypothetical protein
MATVMAEAGAPPRTRTARSKVYVGLALLITAIVFAGFSPSFYGTVVLDAAHPWIIHVHAAVYVGWLALLVTQAVLAARGQIALHRSVGRFGIAWGVLVLVLGVVVSFAVPAIHVNAGEWPMERAERFLAIPLGDMVLFGGFFGAAIAYRSRPEIHKRLVVLAAVAIMFAAVGRMPYVDGWWLVVTLWYSPVVVAMAHDFGTKRRVHPVYWIGVVAMAVVFMRVPLSQTEQWRRIGRALLAPFVG